MGRGLFRYNSRCQSMPDPRAFYDCQNWCLNNVGSERNRRRIKRIHRIVVRRTREVSRGRSCVACRVSGVDEAVCKVGQCDGQRRCSRAGPEIREVKLATRISSRISGWNHSRRRLQAGFAEPTSIHYIRRSRRCSARSNRSGRQSL